MRHLVTWILPALLGVAASGCAPDQSSAAVDQHVTGQLNVGTGLFAQGTTFSVGARFVFRRGSPLDNCGAAPADFKVAHYLSSTEEDLFACDSIKLGSAHALSGVPECAIDVFVQCRAVAVGSGGIALSYKNLYGTNASAEVRAPERIAGNFVGYPELSMASGLVGSLEATLVDVNGVPLQGGTIELSGDLSPVAEVKQDAGHTGWWIRSQNRGTASYQLKASNGLVSDRTARVLAPTDASNIQFFSAKFPPTKDASASVDDAMAPSSLASPRWKIMQWAPIQGATLTIGKGDQVNVIASVVDVAENPVWTGKGSITYALQNSPTTISQPQSMRVSRDDYEVGTDWLSVEALQPGQTTISATWNGKSASLSINVK